MIFSSDRLLQQLDSVEIIDWAVDLKYRDDAYAFLVQSLARRELNDNQTRNALHAIFRIGVPEHIDDVFNVFIEFADASSPEIRTEAVQLAIGFARWVTKWGKRPLVPNEQQKNILKGAVSRGVSSRVSKLAHEFFTET